MTTSTIVTIDQGAGSSKAGSSQQAVEEEITIDEAQEQIRIYMEISDEERELVGQDEVNSPDSVDHANEELCRRMLEVFYDTLKTSMGALLKGSKTPFATYRKSLLSILESVSAFSGPNKIKPYMTLIDEFEKKAFEWHTLVDRSQASWVREEIDRLAQQNTMARLNIEAKSRDLHTKLQRLRTQEENIKSESEFGYQDLKSAQSRLKIYNDNIQRQEEIIAKARAAINIARKSIEQTYPEVESLTKKIQDWSAELAEVQASSEQTSSEIVKVDAELKEYTKLSEEDLQKQAEAQATARKNQELARVENSLREFVENPL